MKALILHATGINRDLDAKIALQMAGLDADIVHINELKAKEKHLKDYCLLVIPGGFSYADSLGAGTLFALELLHYLFDELNEFIYRRKPIIGICNGFQVLIKSGILPGNTDGKLSKNSNQNRTVTLTNNERGRFECTDVLLHCEEDSKCIWTSGITQPFLCPVAHGEGRFFSYSKQKIDNLALNKQVVLKYARKKADKKDCGTVFNENVEYPDNPNGSSLDIAGICDSTGLILGLMPHTENNIIRRKVDSEIRQLSCDSCLTIWKNGVNYAKNS